ncbi:hypothetical protein [Alkalibacillus aidingensis]|uniref:hypothetical protein n=1 Tax=Alkalibacillus aidingensis TaxID=2747607 RepID=UPI00166086F0|nr:hypothetical protein [Alkalibacillus aidingensis]
MSWKYLLFEAKLLINNRKFWFIAVFLLLYFPIYYMIYSDTDPETLQDGKRVEQEMTDSALDQFSDDILETTDGQQVYDNLLDQLSLINMQIYYIGLGNDDQAYIDDGLKLNELRLKNHELNNVGIPEHLIIPKDEVLKEEAFLSYINEKQIPLDSNEYVASKYIVVAVSIMSGLMYYFIVLLTSGDMLVYEKQHKTVVNGFPISFMSKVFSKIALYFVYILIPLILGTLLSIWYAARKEGLGNFSEPVLIYQQGDYTAISTSQYLVYVFGGIVIITLMVLLLSMLLNVLFNNLYATVLIGLGLFLIPELLMAIHWDPLFLRIFKYVDIVNILSGDLALELGDHGIDYWHALTWMMVTIIIFSCILYLINKLNYRRNLITKGVSYNAKA